MTEPRLHDFGTGRDVRMEAAVPELVDRGRIQQARGNNNNTGGAAGRSLRGWCDFPVHRKVRATALQFLQANCFSNRCLKKHCDGSLCARRAVLLQTGLVRT